MRDSRSPTPLNDNVSHVMSSNKGKDTKPELQLRRSLRDAGYPGYRLQWKIPGRPDITYPGKKIAVFVNGCYWHRCPRCDLPLPKTNTEFWASKFENNVKRDKQNVELLENIGWTVIVIWECEIKNDLNGVSKRIVNQINIDRSKVY